MSFTTGRDYFSSPVPGLVYSSPHSSMHPQGYSHFASTPRSPYTPSLPDAPEGTSPPSSKTRKMFPGTEIGEDMVTKRPQWLMHRQNSNSVYTVPTVSASDLQFIQRRPSGEYKAREDVLRQSKRSLSNGDSSFGIDVAEEMLRREKADKVIQSLRCDTASRQAQARESSRRSLWTKKAIKSHPREAAQLKLTTAEANGLKSMLEGSSPLRR